jgi:hypothetical protein
MSGGSGLRALVVGAVAIATLAVSGASVAAALYAENFEADPTAAWTVNNALSDSAANFFFDYSTVGIPLAPTSAAGASRGLKLQANLTNGIFSGLSVSPTGQSFVGNYRLAFDWWANVNGPFPAGGSGSTNLSTFGIGTSGAVAQWPGGTTDSVWFAATGDGNSSADWRAYSTAAPTSYGDGDPVYAAPSRNASDPYYAGFGGVAAPAAQFALFPQQSGLTNVGAAGMAWHEVVIDKTGTTVSWYVDGLLIATIDLTTVVLGGDNIFFGHSDTNTTSSTDPNDADLLFTLIDNVRVLDDAAAVPEPSSLSLIALATLLALAAQLGRVARSRR